MVIEYMGKKNVQNLISFYLNADMYRQFSKKELAKILTSNFLCKHIVNLFYILY